MTNKVIYQPELSNRVSEYHTQNQAVALAAAVLDKRIATAKNWPRSVARFKQEAIALLQEDIETAESAEYRKPVGSGFVSGASIRLAELAAMCWTNIEVEISEPIIGERSVTVQAMAWDIERNIRMPGISTASIVNREGVRYQQHLVETTILAASSKARRNAILAVIPGAYIKDLLAAAKAVASKHQKPLEEIRSVLLDYFARSHRVESHQICDFLGVKGVEDITPEHIDDLRGVANAIKDGEPVDGFFGKAKSKSEAVKEKIAARKAQESTRNPSIGDQLFKSLHDEILAVKSRENLDELSLKAEANWEEFRTDQRQALLDALKESGAKYPG